MWSNGIGNLVYAGLATLILTSCDLVEPESEAATHRVVELPADFQPRDLNDRGEVLGSVLVNGGPVRIPMLWRDGEMIDLAAELGIPSGDGRVTNDLGEALVTAQLSVPCPHGRITYVWRPAAEPTSICGRAGGIDDTGRVLLWLDSSDLGQTEQYIDIWNDGERTSIPIPEPYRLLSMSGLNSRGESVGFFEWADCAVRLGRLGGALLRNGVLEFFDCGARPTALNDLGWYLVGQDGSSYLVKPDEQIRFTDFEPNALNDLGVVAGFETSADGSTRTPALWQDGSVTEIVLQGEGFEIIGFDAINTHGVMLGSRRSPSNASQAFVLVPVVD